jgi:CubicO group peptidase (beta-lactamase class C family)
MVELICGVDELAAPAGTVYRYANEGYLLLAALIERAAGVGINDFVTRRIFAPLGMTRSWYRDSPDAPAADTVGHHLLDATLEPDRSEFHFAGDGGLVTTLDDLRGWAGVLCAPYRLGPALATRLVEQGRLRDGRRIHYAWGISVRPHHGRTIHSHGGRFVGNLAKVVLFPADPAVTFICLANRDDIDIDGLVMDAVNRSMPSTLDFDQPDWRSTLRPDGLRWDDPSMAERPT